MSVTDDYPDHYIFTQNEDYVFLEHILTLCIEKYLQQKYLPKNRFSNYFMLDTMYNILEQSKQFCQAKIIVKHCCKDEDIYLVHEDMAIPYLNGSFTDREILRHIDLPQWSTHRQETDYIQQVSIMTNNKYTTTNFSESPAFINCTDNYEILDSVDELEFFLQNTIEEIDIFVNEINEEYNIFVKELYKEPETKKYKNNNNTSHLLRHKDTNDSTSCPVNRENINPPGHINNIRTSLRRYIIGGEQFTWWMNLKYSNWCSLYYLRKLVSYVLSKRSYHNVVKVVPDVPIDPEPPPEPPPIDPEPPPVIVRDFLNQQNKIVTMNKLWKKL